MSEFLAETNLSNTRPRVVGQDKLVLDQWSRIQQELEQRYSLQHAAILAEPTTDDGLQYDWYTSTPGRVLAASSLSASELGQLRKLADQRIADIRHHGSVLTTESSPDAIQLGKIILAAVRNIEASIPENLYSVGGQPVFVDWGIEQSPHSTVSGAPVISSTERKRDPKKPKTVSAQWLWLVFAALCSFIFVRLIDGCSLVAMLNGGFPDFCRPVVAERSPALVALISERNSLISDVSLLNRQLLTPPVCGYVAPAFPKNSSAGSTVNPRSLSDPGVTNSSGIQIDHELPALLINNIVRDAGGGVCEGVEILAIWEGAVDIDLHLYCPVSEGGSDSVSDDRMIGPGNEKSCGAVYDIASAGGAAEMNIERICLGGAAETGGYLAAIFHDVENGVTTPVSTLVRLVVRGVDSEDSIVIESIPGDEAKAFLPIQIE